MLEAPQTYADRIAGAQRAAGERGIDIMLLVDRENHIYFTGITQIECMALLIPRRGAPRAITLSLDVGFVKENSSIQNVEGYDFPMQNLGASVVRAINEMGFQGPVIGFERYFVSFGMFMALQKGVPGARFVDASEIIYRMRAVKSPAEIGFIEKASACVKAGMDAAVRAIRPGLTEVEVLGEAEYAMRKAGSEGCPFRAQVVAGERATLTHPYAENRPIAGDQIVVIHLGASFNGYTSKMCRTIALGEAPREQREAYSVLVEAQTAAINSLAPGRTAHEVDTAARRIVEEAGLGKYFIDDIGYGIGLRQSEFYPIIGRNRPHLIAENMVVDLMFPTLYERNAGGPRVTDVILVTAGGPRILTDYPNHMIDR